MPSNKRSLPLRFVPAAILLAVVWASSAFATDRYWAGTTDSNWGNNNNWNNGGAPSSGDPGVFNGTFSLQPTLLNNKSAGGIWMTGAVGQDVTVANGGAYILSLSSTTINGTANMGVLIDNANSYKLTINVDLKVADAQTWRNSSGNLFTVGADINMNGKSLTIDGIGNTFISGVMSSGGTFNKGGSGTLTLTGTNTYTGTITVSSGILNIRNSAALGDASSGTSVSSGAELQLQGGIAVGAEALTLNGSGVSGSGALRNISGTNSMSGAITLGSATTIGSDAGTLTLSGALNNGGTLLTATGAGNIALSGVISGSGGLTKNGSGTLTLSGAANTYNGATTVNDGELVLSKSAGTNAFAGSLTVGDGIGAANSAILRWLASDQVPAVTVSIKTDGLLNLNNSSDAIGALNMTGGNVTTGTGTLTLGGTVTGNASASTATISGNLALGANRIFDIADGAAANDMSVSAVVSGAFTVTKNGTGTMVFSGANTYTGATTINAGTLSVGTIGNGGFAGNLGSATNAATNLVLNGGALKYTGGNSSTDRLFSLGISGGTLDSSGAGTITFSNTDSMGFTGSGARTLTLTGTSDGVINSVIGDNGGATSLTKTGSGTWTLSGANTHTGLTTVTAGTLAYGASNVIGSGGVTVNGATAILSLGANQTDSVGTVTLAGGGSITGTGTSALTSTGTFEMQSGSVSVILAGAGIALNKTTSGTVTLSGANTFTGDTTISGGTLAANADGALGATNKVTVNAGGTLLLGATAGNNRVGDTAEVEFAGGTLSTSGLTETVGKLTLTANSTIDFGAGSSFFTFDGLSSLGSSTLTIANWTGTLGQTGGTDRLLFKNASFTDGMTTSQIQFSIGGSYFDAMFKTIDATTFEAVAIPEPSTALAAGFLVALGAFRRSGSSRRRSR